MKIALPLDGTVRTRVHPVSRAVFGGNYVLEAIVAMAQAERFYGADIARLAGCEGSYVSGLLKKFEEAGLIEALPLDDGQRRKYYRRLPAPLWDLAVEWTRSMVEPPDAGIARIPRGA